MSLTPTPNRPAVLKLEPEEFNAALLPLVGVGRTEWTGDDHLQLVEKIVARLREKSGERPKMSQSLGDIIRLIYRPTEAIQRRVLKQALAQEGYALDSQAEQTLALLFSSSQFKDFLEKTENPTTKKPFILKTQRRGVKKNAFAALIGVAEPEPTGEVVPQADDEQGNEDDSQGTDAESQVNLAAEATKTPKAAVKKA